MATFKFYNIVKANAEIDRLEKQVTDLTTERDEARKALESNSTEVQKDLEASLTEAQTENTNLKQQVSARDGEITTLKSQLEEANKKVAAQPVAIKTAASQEAARITAAQGQAPVKVAASDSPEGGAANSAEELVKQMNAIKDPAERTVFFRKNREAILAASRAERSNGK